jgi:hypothetical protein
MTEVMPFYKTAVGGVHQATASLKLCPFTKPLLRGASSYGMTEVMPFYKTVFDWVFSSS